MKSFDDKLFTSEAPGISSSCPVDLSYLKELDERMEKVREEYNRMEKRVYQNMINDKRIIK